MEIISFWKKAERRSAAYQEGLLKAVGVTQHKKPSILDATAGLGRDAFCLAAAGCRVMLVERVSAVADALKQALEVASQDPFLAPAASRMTLVWGDAKTVISDMASDFFPDVIFLDPMYPVRKKAALVKKELRDLRTLVGEDEDSPALLPLALTHALKRVVVKRHRLAVPLATARIHHVILGKTTRYDVYLPVNDKECEIIKT